jgi:polyisoprenoid-binding protein YceI
MSVERWEITSNSEIHFTVPHLLVSKVRGRFTRWSGMVLAPDGDWSRATVEVVIDASSIDTGIAKRDTDLRTANFLDVERYPHITFRSLGVTAERVGRLRVAGELTMRGRVGEVQLEVESSSLTLDPSGSERARFSARAAITRRDFGTSRNLAWDRYGILIGERIDIEIDVEALDQSGAAISFSSDIHDLTVSQG